MNNKKKGLIIVSVLVLMLTFGGSNVYAATGDPISVVNNLSDFVFSLIRAIGIILLGFGIVQVGLSLKSHDPSQRANGFLTVAGGIIITFAKEHPELFFYVTRIGCGIAGFREKEIAPLFAGAVGLENVCLPEGFVKVLK